MRSALIVIALLLCAVRADAKPKKPKKPAPAKVLPCSNEYSCARRCTATNVAACDRLVTLLGEHVDGHAQDTPIKPYYQRVYPLARASLTVACQAPQPRACVLLDTMEHKGLGGDRDASARDRLDARCDDNVEGACMALGQSNMKDRDLPGSLAAFERGCTAGDADACGMHGLFLTMGLGGTEDVAGGVAELDLACNTSGLACELLAGVHESGGPHADPSQVVPYKERACARGAEDSCEFLAEQAEAAGDASTAASLEERGCALDNVFICEKVLARREREGDDARTFAALQRTCELGLVTDCERLASVHREGLLGQRKDPAKATHAAELACEGGHDRVCMAMVMADLGLDPDSLDQVGAAPSAAQLATALGELDAMCSGDNPYACYALAAMYNSSPLVTRDSATALYYYTRTCMLAGPSGCEEASLIEAIVRSERCAAGDTSACQTESTTPPDEVAYVDTDPGYTIDEPEPSPAPPADDHVVGDPSPWTASRVLRMLRLDAGIYQMSPLMHDRFEKYSGGFVSADLRGHRRISQYLGAVGDLRGTLDLGESSGLGYDVNGAGGLFAAAGPIRFDLLGMVGQDATGETALDHFQLAPTYYLGYEVRFWLRFGDDWAFGASRAVLGRHDDTVETRMDFRIDRLRFDKQTISLGVRAHGYDDGTSLGLFLRVGP